MEPKLESTSADASAYKLPPEILEYQELAKRLVRDELLPLEQEYLAHPVPIDSAYRARRGGAFLFAPRALSAFPFVQPAPHPETRFDGRARR